MMSVHVKSTVDKLLSMAEQYMGSSDLIGVCQHTHDMVAGDIYVAVDRGLNFAQEALDKGAVLVIYDSCNCAVDVTESDRIIGVEDLDNVVKELVWRVYGRAIDGVSLIGITGTNGKTSTASFVCELLNILNSKAGYIGTLGFGIIGQSIHKIRNTTPDMVTLYRYIAILYRQGCHTIVVEISSHGIALDRIHGLSFFAGVFTNLSRDHIDFHGSMKNYAAVKRSLFVNYEIDSLIVNLDDEIGRQIAEDWDSNKPVFAFSVKYISPEILRYESYGIRSDGRNHINIQYEGKTYDFSILIHGNFNVANIVAAIASCLALNYSMSDLMQAVLNVSPIPGRMEYLQTDRQVNVFIDYAHTPAGIKAVLTDESVASRDVWCVLGSGGNRDAGKRAEMADMAGYASHIVICDDNVRHDSATRIIIDMLWGIHVKSGTIICRDRKQAIGHVLSKAYKDDNVFLLGKGDEDSIDYGSCQVIHSDRDVVEQYGDIT